MIDTRQKGVALITAIFVLVVVAALVAFMVRINQLQSITTSYSIMAARAHYAANSGLEWGIQRILSGNETELNCGGTAPSLTSTGQALDIFAVTVICTELNFEEGGTSYTVYELNSTAGYPTTLPVNRPDYISRTLTASICANCP